MKVLFSSLFAVLILSSSHAFACEMVKTTDKTLSISHVWGKPNYGPNGAAYFILKNKGKKTRHLIAASSPLSDKVELHTHIKEDGVMKMRKMKDGIIVKPGETLHFKPAGNHVMLLSMKEKLKPGSSYNIELQFKDGSKETLKVAVKDKETKGSHADDKRGSHADDKRGSHTDEKNMKESEIRGSHIEEEKRGSH